MLANAHLIASLHHIIRFLGVFHGDATSSLAVTTTAFEYTHTKQGQPWAVTDHPLRKAKFSATSGQPGLTLTFRACESKSARKLGREVTGPYCRVYGGWLRLQICHCDRRCRIVNAAASGQTTSASSASNLPTVLAAGPSSKRRAEGAHLGSKLGRSRSLHACTYRYTLRNVSRRP